MKALGLHSYFWNNLYFIQETKLFGEKITDFCLQSTNKIAVQTSTLFSTQEEGTHQEIPHAPCISSKALSDGLTMLLTANHNRMDLCAMPVLLTSSSCVSSECYSWTLFFIQSKDAVFNNLKPTITNVTMLMLKYVHFLLASSIFPCPLGD